jgi:hypothetical protein
MPDHGSNHDCDNDELYAPAAGSDNNGAPADRVKELEAQVAELKQSLTAIQERDMALSTGNLDPFRPKPTPQNGSGAPGASSTTDAYGPVIQFIQNQVGEQALAGSAIRVEKTFEMFRKFGVEHDEEKALELSTF